MHIPRAWVRLTAEGRTADGRTLPVAAWGWGDDEAGARHEAAGRLQRLLDRLRRGESFPAAYAYGNRPLREEILETLDGAALLTRNAYGTVVLNTARLLFLDIDAPPPKGWRLGRLFGRAAPAPAAAIPGALRAALLAARTTFRVYATASGLRAVAIDREFDPAGADTQTLMEATGTDPAFARLCRAQKSFRARLTPKPWRCRLGPPPSSYPHPDEEARRRFAAWLGEYERAAAGYATCRYLGTIGDGTPRAAAVPLVELHDRVTRCRDALPLA